MCTNPFVCCFCWSRTSFMIVFPLCESSPLTLLGHATVSLLSISREGPTSQQQQDTCPCIYVRSTCRICWARRTLTAPPPPLAEASR